MYCLLACISVKNITPSSVTPSATSVYPVYFGICIVKKPQTKIFSFPSLLYRARIFYGSTENYCKVFTIFFPFEIKYFWGIV